MKIKGSARRQNHATAAKRLRMVEQFRRSGLTRAAFCQQHGIPLATLSWWLAKSKRTSNLPVPVVFSEVMLPPAPAAATSTWAMEVLRPDGLVIRFREAFCANEVARMLRGLRC